MKYKGYVIIVIGLIFIFLNITLNRIDIIPDPIGYIFIIAGLISLSPLHKSFKKAVPAAAGLLVLSIIDIFTAVHGAEKNLTPDYFEAAELGLFWVLSILTGIFNVALLSLLCRGTIDLLEERNFSNESRVTKNCFVYNIIVRVLSCMPFVMFFIAFPVLFILLIVIALISTVWLMVRLYRIYKILGEYEVME